MNLLEILKFAEEYLKKYSFSNPRLEAEKVVSAATNMNRLNLYMNFEKMLTEAEKEEIKNILKKMVTTNKKFADLGIEKKDFLEENKTMLKQAIDYLKKLNVPNAKLDVEYIFEEVLKISRIMLSLSMTKELSQEEKNKIKELLIQRGKKRMPLQYILGYWDFYGYRFKTDNRALIPRADTEILAENCINLLSEHEGANILEVGVGSGALSIVLAKEIKSSTVIGLDISKEALSLAEENRILNEAENVRFVLSDLFSSLDKAKKEGKKIQKFDLIVSNPPYISLEEYKTLMPEVLEYEPKIALTDGGDGLKFYREITKQAKEYLAEEGYLVFEIGYNQADSLAKILKEEDYSLVNIVKDYGQNPRVVIAKRGVDKDVNTFE